MTSMARVSTFAILISLLVFSMSGCPGAGGLPSIVGTWRIVIEGVATVGVQFNEDGSAETVNIGTGQSLGGTITWTSISTAGIEFRESVGDTIVAIHIGTLNADGTMNGLCVTGNGVNVVEVMEWSATKL